MLQRGKLVKAQPAVLLLAAMLLPAWAQYPGHISTEKKPEQTLRAIAVLEWTGQPGKPSASRIIPIAVYDGEQYQPGGLYLARPAPLAVESGTEYILQQSGVAQGLFDVYTAQDVQGYWFGYGTWKPLAPTAKPHPLHKSRVAPQVVTDSGDPSRPHLKIHPGATSDSSGQGNSGQGSGQSSGQSSGQGSGQAPAGSTSGSTTPSDDPDRPTLKRRADSSSPSDSGNSSATNDAPPSASDPERPTLRHRSSSAGSPTSNPAVDPSAPETPIGGSDPDRPRLTHDIQTPTNTEFEETKLTGAPPNLEQMIAVSDAADREPHPFVYQWAEPGDAAKMQAQMETLAQQAILASEPAPAKPAAKAHSTTQTTRRTHKTSPPPPPQLTNEVFKAYELTYSGGATLVFSAQTTGADGKVKYVTLIAQPDFNGVPIPLLKSVTDDDHLEAAPRMRLVDAVDAKANNRGDLIFELQSKNDRQFVIYRIAEGRAEQVFTTGSLSNSNS